MPPPLDQKRGGRKSAKGGVAPQAGGGLPTAAWLIPRRARGGVGGGEEGNPSYGGGIRRSKKLLPAGS